MTTLAVCLKVPQPINTGTKHLLAPTCPCQRVTTRASTQDVLLFSPPPVSSIYMSKLTSSTSTNRISATTHKELSQLCTRQPCGAHHLLRTIVSIQRPSSTPNARTSSRPKDMSPNLPPLARRANTHAPFVLSAIRSSLDPRTWSVMRRSIYRAPEFISARFGDVSMREVIGRTSFSSMSRICHAL